MTTWEYLNGIDVLAPSKAAAIATIGDSITDGAYSTADANQRWPDELARRIQTNPKYKRLSVINEAISGNKILMDRAGPNALARFDRDILSQSGVKYLIVLEGINDIGHIQTDPTTASDLIRGLDQMIVRAHTHGIVVIGGTLTPFRGFDRYFSEKTEAIRTTINQWIRTSGAFDAVIDFDAAIRDPNHPDTFLPAYDHGDHLHPNDAGYKAMGDFIDLKLFTLKPCQP
jgi:lysophospholipase L1-like esterase